MVNAERTNTYFILLTEDQYKEFCDIAHEVKYFLLKKLCDKFEKEAGRYSIEISKTEFCMAICQLKIVRRNTKLIPRFMELGKLQDINFPHELATVERDCRKFSLFDH